MRSIGGVLAAGIFLCAPSCAAQETRAPVARSVVRFITVDNDSWFNTDRYCTSGVQLASRSAEDSRGELARRWLDRACRLFGCVDARFLYAQHSVGQLIYSPADSTIAPPQRLDRPYAGLLYAERQWLFLESDGEAITTLAAQAGLTGRLSLAEPSQKLLHRILDRPEPMGWDHQVGNTLAVLVSAERRPACPWLSGTVAGQFRATRLSAEFRAG